MINNRLNDLLFFAVESYLTSIVSLNEVLCIFTNIKKNRHYPLKF